MSHNKEIQSFLHVPLPDQTEILKILSKFSSIKDFHLIKFSKKIILKIIDILNYPKQQKEISLYVKSNHFYCFNKTISNKNIKIFNTTLFLKKKEFYLFRLVPHL